MATGRGKIIRSHQYRRLFQPLGDEGVEQQLADMKEEDRDNCQGKIALEIGFEKQDRNRQGFLAAAKRDGNLTFPVEAKTSAAPEADVKGRHVQSHCQRRAGD